LPGEGQSQYPQGGLRAGGGQSIAKHSGWRFLTILIKTKRKVEKAIWALEEAKRKVELWPNIQVEIPDDTY
jgi:hypothetical protein